MTGGELYEHVIRKGHFSEYDAAVLMRDLISALHELHSNDILHLDIKPENILFDTDAEDARVKITDFGLSKVYNQEHKTSLDPKKRNPTMEELDKSLKSFQESGVLNRDRLRGTVGYMSPELILAGHSSTATDVWAAGVVLYILLCGRPPFQSRSNREILEKSAKGEYSMEGKDWAEVSAEAKDLVSRMLTVDPDARITCPDILAHPWIKIGIEEEEARKAAAASQSDKNSVGSGRGDKRSAANLQAAMRALSGHVNDRKMEKMMTNFGRLVSSLQQGKTDGHRLVKLLGLEEGESEVLQGSGTVMTMEVRDALMHAFRLVGGEDNNGKITVEQFCQLLSHFGYGGESGVSTSGALLLICRFIDRYVELLCYLFV
jgi:serine/threonine protein kinase